jgi:tetratricopeptide (TPR) repeat protein
VWTVYRTLTATQLLAGAMAVLLTLGAAAPPAVAQTAPAPAVDTLEVVHLGTPPPPEDSAPGTLTFEVLLQYHLATSRRGFLLIFFPENGAASSSQEGSQAIWVEAGSGELDLAIDYRPNPSVQTVRLAVSLFTEDERLLTYVATPWVEITAWYGRSAFEQAMVARDNGDHATTVEQLSRAIQLSPDVANYYYWRADSNLHLGRHDDAIRDYTRALELMPDDRASRLGRAAALLGKRDHQAAIADFTLVIQQREAPDQLTAWAHHGRGLAYVGLNQPAEAIADYEAYLALAPNAPNRAEVEQWIAELR